MKKCKYLKDEKCIGCSLCEPVIKLTGEQAEALVNSLEHSIKFNDRNMKH
jgi:Fe-S-cluster-containing hydrogenase component 2